MISTSSIINMLANSIQLGSMQDPPPARAVQGADTGPEAVETAQRGTVQISTLAQALHAKLNKAENKNSDIDDSGLPDAIKRLLKAIREIKEKLREQQEQLRAVMADRSLSDEDKATKMSSIQATMGTLQGALARAMQQLEKLIKDLKLGEEGVLKVMGLLIK